MALHATTIRFADRAYTTIARAADAQGISVSQYVREAALIRAVLDELDSAEEALHTAHDLLAIAREVRRLAEVDPPDRRARTPAADAPALRSPGKTANETLHERQTPHTDSGESRHRHPSRCRDRPRNRRPGRKAARTAPTALLGRGRSAAIHVGNVMRR